MIAIIAIIVVVILILITSYIFYRQRLPNEENNIHSKQIFKKTSIEISNTPGKKSKKQKRGLTKGANPENESKQSSDDFHESVKQITKVCVPEDTIVKENLEIAEPLLQASYDSKCMTMKSVVNKPGWNDDKKPETEQFQIQILKLNDQLEKAADENVTLKNEAASLNDENKAIKSQLKKSESSKSKIEEQLKKSEKSHNDSLVRFGDLERKLHENSAQNLELKHEIETINGKLHQKEIDLKMEQEKMHIFQKENEASSNKYKELFAKNKTDNENHKEMYRKYEEVIGKNKMDSENHKDMYRKFEERIDQLNGEKKQMKAELSQLDELLVEKNEIINNQVKELQKINMTMSQVTNENKQLSGNLKEISCTIKSKEALVVSLEEEKKSFMTEMFTNSEALESKIEKLSGESEKKDWIIEELKRDKSQSENEIENLNNKLRHKDEEVKHKFEEMKILLDVKTADLQNISQDKSALLNEVENLKRIVYNKDEHLQEKLMEMSKELKEKNNDLSRLQDQKLSLVQNIENLKKELSIRDEEMQSRKTVLDEDMAGKEALVFKLRNDNSTLLNEIDQLRSQVLDTKNKFSNLETKIVCLSTELKTKTENSSCLENDKTVLSGHVERLKKELVDKEESFKTQLAKSENAIPSPNKVKATRGKKGDISKEKDSHKPLIADNHLFENQPINETFQAKCYRESQTAAPSSDSSVVIQGMQSHIEKVETELLHLQKKYYDLKNANPALVRQMCNKPKENLQKSFSDTSTEKNHLNSEYTRLMEDHDRLYGKYETLIKEFTVLKNSSQNENIDQISLLNSEIEKLHEDNCHLKAQLEQYRETLEKTESCLQNIQASVDQEENNWKICLKSSEQEQERLESKNKELLNQIEELSSKKNSESSAVISMETPSISNGSLKKKRKNKNKKKKNKNRVTQ